MPRRERESRLVFFIPSNGFRICSQFISRVFFKVSFCSFFGVFVNEVWSHPFGRSANEKRSARSSSLIAQWEEKGEELRC